MINFDIVVAHDLANAIGKNNQLLCHLPEDMRFFKELTTTTTNKNKQNIVILGRKTYESLPDKFKPLPNRINIVISRSTIDYKGVLHATSPENALEIAANLVEENKAETVYCIGGSQIYKNLLTNKKCRFLYATVIHKTFEADAFFPDYQANFTEVSSRKITSKNNLDVEFKKLKFNPN